MATGRSDEHATEPDCYDLDVRPVDEADTGWLGEDSIVVGAESPRWTSRPWASRRPSLTDKLPRLPVVAVLGLIGLALVIVVAISARHPSRPIAVVAPTTSDATESPSGPPLSPAQLALAQMVALARSPIALTNYLAEANDRPNCRPSAMDPAKAIAGVVTQYLPSYRLLDSGTVLEQSGICSVQERFTNDAGTVIVISVVRPAADFTPFVALSSDNQTSAMDILTNEDGWWIEIGAVGQPDLLPSQRDLTDIAADARLQWSDT